MFNCGDLHRSLGPYFSVKVISMASQENIPKIIHVIKLFKTILSETRLNNQFILQKHVGKICEMASTIKREDVSFYPAMINNAAPATFIGIFDDKVTVSSSIFGLPEGRSLPLHDHPGMYGFIKCIYGSLAVQSYTAVSQNNSSDLDFGQVIVSVTKESDITLCESDDTVAVLEPVKGNIHTITAINGPAAFIDFLSPPYSDGKRDCYYYTNMESSEHSTNVSKLRLIPSPSWFWTAPVSYCGPRV